MAQDIEEFLRMAAARKKQQAAGGAPQQPNNQQPNNQQPNRPGQQQGPASHPQAQQPRAQQQRPAPQSQQPDPDIFILDEEQPQQISKLQSSIQTTVSTQDIADHTSHLGEQVHQRQDITDSRVHDKFDHNLGRLQKQELSDPSVVDHGKGVENVPDISMMLNMIRNPNSLKQAIILKEIFDRPKF